MVLLVMMMVLTMRVPGRRRRRERRAISGGCSCRRRGERRRRRRVGADHRGRSRHPAEFIQLAYLLFLLLDLHTPILKPDLYLAFGEAERVGDFDPTFPREVAVELEFLFKLQRLIS